MFDSMTSTEIYDWFVDLVKRHKYNQVEALVALQTCLETQTSSYAHKKTVSVELMSKLMIFILTLK